MQLEHQLVDSAAMLLLTRAADFDVIVTENLFGDILSDEAAALAGSLGLMPSASLGDDTRGLYEPIHGSAPDIAGQGVANPYGAIASAALLLRHSLALPAEAAALENAIAGAVAAGVLTRGHRRNPARRPQARVPRATRCWSVSNRPRSSARGLDRAPRQDPQSGPLTASMPIDSRSSPGVMPAASRAAGSMPAWVIVSGCATRLSTPPSDSASEKQDRPSRKRRTAGFPPASSRLTMAPKARC